jgi:hypothetical protein
MIIIDKNDKRFRKREHTDYVVYDKKNKLFLCIDYTWSSEPDKALKNDEYITTALASFFKEGKRKLQTIRIYDVVSRMAPGN